MNPEKKRDHFFYLSLINLFWVGMNCPDLSQGFFFLCTIIMIFWFDHKSADRIPTILLSVFIAYLFFNYIPLLMFGFIKPFQFIKEPLFLLACYKYGHFLGRSRMKNWPGGIIYILLAMVSGFVVFSFLSIYMAPNVSIYAEQTLGGAKAGRTGIMIWTGKPGGFGPILGVQGNMGSAFLPVIILGGLNEIFKTKKEYLLIVGVSLLFILLGFYTNVLLKNRGPFVILVGLIMVVGAYNIIFGPKRLTPAKLTTKIILLLSVIIISILLIRFMPSIDLSHYGVVSRFTTQGSDSPRTEFWKNCIRIIAQNPLGGRKGFFGHTYAHNIWLDVGYDSGIIAMFFLIIFHCMHFKDMADLIFKKLPIHPGVISAMLVMFFIIFISLFTEPIGKGYTIYYAITFFYCGLLKRLKTDGTIIKKELYFNEINNHIRNAGRLQA